ncbi:MAG TPA: hypothetical protein ENJ11_06300 [Gammaproteobacteria bacterium]|nr:hypothetical protein [Gammaproteobacteria bacterium]
MLGLSGREKIVLAIAVLIMAGVLLPLPSDSMWWREAMNSGHVLLFMLVAWLLFYALRRRMPDSSRWKLYGLLLFVGLLFGLIIEFLQIFVHRDASWADWLKDLAGLLAGIASLEWYLGWKQSTWWRKLVIAGLFVGVLALSLKPFVILSLHYVQRGMAFPVLMDFEAGWSSSFVDYVRAKKLSVKSGILTVRLEKGQYPGVSLTEVEPDWSGYRSLVLELESSQDSDISLVVRVDDQLHNQRFEDRYNHRFVVHPGKNRLVVSLSQVEHAPEGRLMNMKRINEVKIFALFLDESVELGIGKIYLQKQSGASGCITGVIKGKC